MVVLMRTTVILGLVIFSLLGSISRPDARQGTAREVEIVAERFSFTPSEVRVPLGTSLRLRIRSDDTMHGFRIIGKGVNILIPKRRQGEVVVHFEATEAGRFEFWCSRLCGAGHNFMRGAIVVFDDTRNDGEGI